MENLPLPDSESDSTPEQISPADYPFVMRAVYEVAKILKDEEFASSITAWGFDENNWPHAVALSMLVSVNRNAEKMIRDRINELRAQADTRTSRVKKLGSLVLSPLRNLFS